MLLVVVLGFIIYLILNNKLVTNDKKMIKFNQIYSSDYELSFMGDNYFVGSYEGQNNIDVIIDSNGTEVYRPLNGIYYEYIYKTLDEKYIIFSTLDNNLNVYLFDGNKIEEKYHIENVPYIKPIIYKDRELNQEYIIGFVATIDNNLYLYNLDSNEATILSNTSLVADILDTNIYYIYNKDCLIAKDNEGLMGVIDLKGNVIIDYEYKNIISSFNDYFVVVNKKDKYGVINKDKKELIKCSYNVIAPFDKYFLIVNSKNKMALFDDELNDVTGFKMDYNQLITYDFRNTINSIDLIEINSKVLVVNNNMEDINGTEYSKHNLYVISDGKIEKNIIQKGFGYDNVIYTLDKDNDLTVYEMNLEEIFTIKIEDNLKIKKIRKLGDKLIQIIYIDNETEKSLFYNLQGEEVNNDLGTTIDINTNLGIIVTFKGEQIVVYNNSLEEVGSISGASIKVMNDYLIVNKEIFKMSF